MISLTENLLFKILANDSLGLPTNRSQQVNPNIMHLQNGLKINHCRNMHGWQGKIVQELATTNNDIYITTPPGGGKTLPLVCHWTNNILQLNTIFDPSADILQVLKNCIALFERPSSVTDKKLVITVPTRQLAELTTSDFLKHFIDLFIESFSFIFNKIDNHLFANVNNNSTAPNLPLTPNLTYQDGQRQILQSIQHIFNIMKTPHNWKYNEPGQTQSGDNLEQAWKRRANLILDLNNTANHTRVIDTTIIANNISRFIDQINNNIVFGIANRSIFEIINPKTLYGINLAIEYVHQITEKFKANPHYTDDQKIQYESILISFYRTLIDQQKQIIDDIQKLNKQITELYAVVFKNIADSYVYLKTGVSQSNSNIQTCGVVICIYENSYNVLKDVLNKIHTLVIDESHSLQKQPDEIKSRAIEGFEKMNYTFNEINPNTKLIFLSGTIHPQSAVEIKKFLKLEYNRNLSILDDEGQGKNASNISVIADNRCANSNFLVNNVITNTGSRGNLIVLFSKEKINKLAQLALSQMGGSTDPYVTKGGNSVTRFTSMHSYQEKPIIDRNHFDTENIRRSANPGSNAENIFDDMQREYVRRGFAVIYRPNENDKFQKEKNNDMKIVSDLFSQGKIRTIIATDAVGIGVNLAVQTLYIPEIQKFSGKETGNQPLPRSDLAQVLHRTGRAAFKVSRIITTSENVSSVTNALYADRSSYDQRVLILPQDVANRYNKRLAWVNILQFLGAYS